MLEIKPQVASMDIICAETPAPPCAMVIFGASGDLVYRKLIPSLAEIYRRDLLNKCFCLIGCGRTDLSDHDFRDRAGQAIQNASGRLPASSLEAFLKRLYYIGGDYQTEGLYQTIQQKLMELSDIHHFGRPTVLFYLSVPPGLYGTIAEHLCKVRLCCPRCQVQWQSRLVVEKPFGRDLASATSLNQTISQCFAEQNIFRIDHYLGKETVQNILMFRFANSIFEPIWNRNYIDHVQLTIAETLGVEHRGSYYDQAGALRDMFQNHMLQMLTLVAMEPPVSFEADRVRDEKIKLLRSIQPITSEQVDRVFVRGQYAHNKINDQELLGYRHEPGVDPMSMTETYVAARLSINNWRWEGVPFYLRTGKRLASKDTEIAITFKQVPHSMLVSVGLDAIPPNVLVLKIQPQEGISLRFQAKRPGSKMCMGTLNMHFDYESVFGVQMPDAYQRLLLDCMLGDQTLFMRFDTLETTWQLLDPVLEAWEKSDTPPVMYPAGCHSFPQADRLIESDGRQWRPLT